MPDLPVLSICVPAFDERATVAAVIERLLALRLPVPFEVVAVDDGSADGTAALLREAAARSGGRVRALFHDRNRGKAAALSTAFAAARGEVLAVQDADLEYDPADLPRCLAPILEGRADAVFGSRFLPGSKREGAARLQVLANRALTTLSNAFTGLRVTDMETGRKLFLRKALGPLPLRAERFGVEPELCARLAASGARVLELPIAYHARGRAEGKKIGWRDGLEAAGWIARTAPWPRRQAGSLVAHHV